MITILEKERPPIPEFIMRWLEATVHPDTIPSIRCTTTMRDLAVQVFMSLHPRKPRVRR